MEAKIKLKILDVSPWFYKKRNFLHPNENNCNLLFIDIVTVISAKITARAAYFLEWKHIILVETYESLRQNFN